MGAAREFKVPKGLVMAYSEFFKGGLSGKGFLDKGTDTIKFERSWPSIVDAFLDIINKIEPKIRVPDISSRYIEYAVKVNMDTPNSPYNEIAMLVGIAKFADMILWKSSDPYDWVTARIKEHLIENFNPFEILPFRGDLREDHVETIFNISRPEADSLKDTIAKATAPGWMVDVNRVHTMWFGYEAQRLACKEYRELLGKHAAEMWRKSRDDKRRTKFTRDLLSGLEFRFK